MKFFAYLLICFTITFASICLASPITPGGQKLRLALDHMHVTHYWLPNRYIHWRTGKIADNEISKGSTHCSAFAAAFAAQLGIYLLRPPEHSQSLLANAQFSWLTTAGPQYGWSRLPDGISAQNKANQGCLVLASFDNPKPDRAGHIAVIRPNERSADSILTYGPQITQAGKENLRSATLRHGFKNHPQAFQNNQIKYFIHSTRYCHTH